MKKKKENLKIKFWVLKVNHHINFINKMINIYIF